MRLIDADELRPRIIALCIGCNNTYLGTANILMMISQAETVDAIPVVRCRECINFTKTAVNGKGFRICPASGMDITPGDYCSLGERKN